MGRIALSMRCFVLLALAAVVVNSAPIFMPAPIGDEVLDKLDNDLDNLLETQETAESDRYYTEKEKDQMAADDAKAPMKNGVVSPQEKAAENGTARDPFKQLGTYTDAMKKHDALTARRLSKPVPKVNGVRKRVGPLDYFDTASDQKKRAAQIATHIYRIIKGPVKKKVTKTALQRSIEKIKAKGRKDAKFLNRIYKASLRRDRKQRAKSQRRQDRRVAEKRKPKLSILHQKMAALSAEDRPAEKGPKIADSKTIAEIEADGLPSAQEIQAAARAKVIHPHQDVAKAALQRHAMKALTSLKTPAQSKGPSKKAVAKKTAKAALLDNSEEA